MKKNIILIIFLFLTILKSCATPNELYHSAWEILNNNYYDRNMNGQDWKVWEYKYKDLKNYKDAYLAIETMLESLNDPYTVLLKPTCYKNEILDIEGKTFDYGIRLKITPKGYLIIPVKNSIATSSGLKKNDFLLELDELSVKDCSLEDLEKKLIPTNNKPLKILVNRDGQKISIELLPQEKEIQSIFDKPLSRKKIPQNIKYLRIPSFMNKNVAECFKNTIDASPNVDGYIIDLRDNLGGVAKNGAVMANMLLTNCIITTIEDRYGNKKTINANEHLLTSKPIVILINNNTASTSEIFIAAIKENNRGILIGEKSFGKGIIQDIFNLPNNCGLNVTVRRYLTPQNNYIQGNGIEPNIHIKSSKLNTILKNDVVLKKAINIIQKM